MKWRRKSAIRLTNGWQTRKKFPRRNFLKKLLAKFGITTTTPPSSTPRTEIFLDTILVPEHFGSAQHKLCRGATFSTSLQISPAPSLVLDLSLFGSRDSC